MLTFKLDGRVPSFGQDRHLQRDQGVQGHWCQLQERLLQVLKRPRWGPPCMNCVCVLFINRDIDIGHMHFMIVRSYVKELLSYYRMTRLNSVRAGG